MFPSSFIKFFWAFQYIRPIADSGRWWRTGKPGVLKSTGSQRVGHYLAKSRTQLSEGSDRTLQRMGHSSVHEQQCCERCGSPQILRLWPLWVGRGLCCREIGLWGGSLHGRVLGEMTCWVTGLRRNAQHHHASPLQGAHSKCHDAMKVCTK